MFRGPQILTWSCPKWSLLLLRESYLSAFSDTGAVWRGACHVRGRRYEEICGRGQSKESSLPTETVSYSTQLSLFRFDCDKHRLQDASFQSLLSKAILSSHHQPFQISASAKVCTTCLQPWKRPWNFIKKTLCNFPQSYLCYRQQSVRPFSLSTNTQWILNNLHNRPQPSSFSTQQIKPFHQAAPRVVDAWRDCLSPENEDRCRQALGPNLKLYEVEKVRKGAGQSQGKNQGRWASILVSLCSVEGEPVFLFTLRSSTLKGRHKGDVRLVTG